MQGEGYKERVNTSNRAKGVNKFQELKASITNLNDMLEKLIDKLKQNPSL